MGAVVLAAGLDARGLLLEAAFLQRGSHVVDECPSGRALLAALAGSPARLVVLGTGLSDLEPVELVRRLRAEPATRRVSVLGIVPASAPAERDGQLVAAGANAVLRRPLDAERLEAWLSKLLAVPRRVEARVPVQAVVLGALRQPTLNHFYGQARNLSVHGMLLASSMRLPADPELELQFELPGAGARVRALGRVVRESDEVAWPFVGYGIEFLFVPPRRRGRDQPARGQPAARRRPAAPDALHPAARRLGLRDPRARAPRARVVR